MEMHHKNPYLVPNLTEIIADRDRGDRVPQWTQAETKEFLAIRADLDRSFAEAKRNKALWETVSARLQLKGFSRTSEQCKSKWKNLVTRFKGSETMEGADRFPFQEEMRGIFGGRMERLLRFDRGKGQEEEYEEEEEQAKEIKSKKRRKKAVTTSGGEAEKALKEFGKRQMEMQLRWMEAAEARETERRSKEEEWRRQMAALAEERAEAERRWREREEERRAREDVRDERRHAVIVAIVTRLANLGSTV